MLRPIMKFLIGNFSSAAQELKSRSRAVRLLRSDEDAEKIADSVQRLSWSMQSFMVCAHHIEQCAVFSHSSPSFRSKVALPLSLLWTFVAVLYSTLYSILLTMHE